MEEQNLSGISEWHIVHCGSDDSSRLVESDPVLDTIAHSLEDDTSVSCKVLNPFFLVQETTIALIKLLGCVPVVQGDEGSDTSGNQVVDELDVVLKPSLVDGVIAAAFGNDSSPVLDMSIIHRRLNMSSTNHDKEKR